MTAPRPHGPAKPLAWPKLGGVFHCVDDAFENKTLPLDALSGGPRDPSGGEPYCGPRGLSEILEDRPEVLASGREQPSVAPARGSPQVRLLTSRTPPTQAGAVRLRRVPGTSPRPAPRS